uniref:Uncharacterized protein n=1 Tax=Anguilla anguilla TaxID=7936 RepID=A0A0E9PAN2_ANGAN
MTAFKSVEREGPLRISPRDRAVRLKRNCCSVIHLSKLYNHRNLQYSFCGNTPY